MIEYLHTETRMGKDSHTRVLSYSRTGQTVFMLM